MGELFGLSAPESRTWHFEFRLDAGSHGHYNREGWGVTFFQGNAAVTIKEASFAPTPAATAFMADAGFIRGESILAYLRRWTTRSGLLANAHPFTREMGGREWAFAHNGNVEGIREELPLGNFRPLGNTDSEYAFCYLLERLRPGDSEPQWTAVLAEEALRIAKFGAFNFLLTNGELFWGYCSGEYGLSYLVRKKPSTVGWSDEDWVIRTAEPTAGVLMASVPLSDEPWHSFKPGELLVARRGELVERRRTV